MRVIQIFVINWNDLKINIEEVIITTDCINLTSFRQTLSRFMKPKEQKLLLFCVYKSDMDEQHQVNMTQWKTNKYWDMSIYLTNSFKTSTSFSVAFFDWLKACENALYHTKQQSQLITQETRDIDKFNIYE